MSELEKEMEELERERPLPSRLLEILARLKKAGAPPALVDVLARGAQSTLSKLADGATLYIFTVSSPALKGGMEIRGRTLRFSYRLGERLKVVYARCTDEGRLYKVKMFEGGAKEEVARAVEEFFEALLEEVEHALA